MTYLVSCIILANSVVVPYPVVVYGSEESCERAKAKIIKSFSRDIKDIRFVGICTDR